MRSRRTRVVMVALVAGLAFTAGACSGSGGGQLLLAGDTSQQQQARSDIWAVDPGDAVGDSAVVAKDVSSPLSISTVQPDGLQWVNQLGREWENSTLLAYATGDTSGTSTTGATSLVTAGDPGANPTKLLSTQGQLNATVLRRGLAIRTDDGCSLAKDPSSARSIAKGACQISDDERWVVSWPATPGPLTIRDLRTNDTRTVSGIKTEGAIVMGHDARVLAVEEVSGGVRGTVIDATNGKIVGHTPTYGQMQPVPSSSGATGFVSLALSGQEVQLIWIGTDADTSVIDTGQLMVPVLVNSEVTYLRLDKTAEKDSLRRWTPGGSDGDRTVLLTGKVGAAAATADSVVATRDTATGVEFYRTGTSGDLEQVLSLRADTSAGSLVSRMFVQGNTALMQVTTGQTSSFVRVRLRGDGSDAPIRNWPYLLLESIDNDGTALLTRSKDPQVSEDVVVVSPDDDSARRLARADATGVNLIHDGVVYYTAQSNSGTGSISVRSVRATGDRAMKVLYRGYQIAGATWPEDNGATESRLISRALIQQQQQQQQQQQAQSQAGSADGTGQPTG